VCGVWCVVCGVWCVVCGVWCVVCGVWCVVCGVWSVGRSILVRILADFGKFYKTRHSSTTPQFWLILPNSTCFSFYTTSNSG
jgi:hypothetical protein